VKKRGREGREGAKHKRANEQKRKGTLNNQAGGEKGVWERHW